MMRLGFLAAFVALLFYLYVFWDPRTPIDPTELAYNGPEIAVPEVSLSIVREAQDATHEQRLFLEPKPLRHLLEKSLDVASADTTAALGMPIEPVPLAELRKDTSAWRGRWIWYKGRLEALEGPRKGHPVAGQEIYEATLRLPDGELAVFTFSQPPGADIQIGSWARAEGFLLKLRDLTLPQQLESVPMLVGRQLQLAYEDWDKVTDLDRDVLDKVVDTTRTGSGIETADEAWRRIGEDQSMPLWHLAAYARAHRDIPLQEWRKIPALTAADTWDQFKRNEVTRGTPMRILGVLAMTRTIAADANPAGIARWTEAWVQVKDLGGKTIPVWVPSDCKVALGNTVEIRGYYFRRLAYESLSRQQYWTPLFVAAEIDPFEMNLAPAMREIGMVLLTGTTVLLALAFWGIRRERKRSRMVEEALLQRRRRRKHKDQGAAAASGTAG